MPRHRVFAIKFSKVYPLYIQKAERKNRTKEEVDRVICWLTGYSQAELRQQIEQELVSRIQEEFDTQAVLISAEQREGLDQLRQALTEKIEELYSVRYPYRTRMF